MFGVLGVRPLVQVNDKDKASDLVADTAMNELRIRIRIYLLAAGICCGIF